MSFVSSPAVAEIVRPAPLNLGTTVEVGFREILAHKFRSMLTMLGIILGVSSLVAMSALVKGMEKGAKEALVAIGGLEKVRVEQQDLPADQQNMADQAVGITANDITALQQNAPLITRISPEMRQFGATLSYHGKTFRPFTVSGVWPVALEMSEHVIAHGRMFNEIDDEMARSVCVIGTAMRDELFGAPDEIGEEIIPLGETIYINGLPFTIIGMFQHYESENDRRLHELAKLNPQPGLKTGPRRSRGWGGRRGNFVFWLKNATVFMPLNTMWMKFRTGTPLAAGQGASASTPAGAGDPRLTSLELRVQSIDLLPEALQQARNVLMSTHKGIEDFTFRTQEDWAENIATFVHNARLSGGLIAGISLLVGGIGIMNIMLASISERVREIGIRKSVGATTFDIFVQILVESVVIAVMGGLVGLATSFGLVQMLRSFSPTDNALIITFGAMAIAFGFSALVGVLAGLFTAVKASRLHPIQALRYD